MPTPLESQSREYEVFLRGPVPSMRFAFTTTNTSNAVRGGIRHEPRLAIFPSIEDNETDEFGIQSGGSFTVEIIDDMSDVNWFLLRSDGDSFLLRPDGSRLILAISGA